MKGGSHTAPVPEMQADASLTQASPVAGTFYTVLDTVEMARILSMYCRIVWTVQPDPINIKITVDGQTQTGTLANPASATSYFIHRVADGGTVHFLFATTSYVRERHILLEGRSVKIEISHGGTTPGTVSQLIGKVRYAKW